MNNDLISVIIPVYNTEKYLDKCVDSVVNQTYKNLEIILIDDGSTDSSPEICDKWAEKDSRIKVIHKENGGVSAARNVAMEAMNGKYFAFVDSDDYIENNMYQTLYTKMVSEDFDFVCCNIRYIDENNQEQLVIDLPERTDYDANSLIISFLNKSYAISPCNKLYKSEIAKSKQIIFDTNIVYGEDYMFNYYFTKNSLKASVVSNKFYNYLDIREGSTTYGLNKGYLLSWQNVKFIMELEKNNQKAYSILLGRYANDLLTIAVKLCSSRGKDYFNEYFPQIVLEIQNNYDLICSSDNLSSLRRISLKLIKISPFLFRCMFLLYSKVYYK